MRIAVLGAGNMGTAIAYLCAQNKHNVTIWNYAGDLEPLVQINTLHRNKKYFPSLRLPTSIIAENDIAKAVAGAKVVFFVVASAHIASVVQQARPYLEENAVCVLVAKGFGKKIGELLSEMLASQKQRAIILGPAVAGEMVGSGVTAMQLVANTDFAATQVERALAQTTLVLTRGTDWVGTEMSGAIKNVYAIAFGICDGLHLPFNSQALVLTAAFREMKALVLACGGKVETVDGIAGLGDLFGTAINPASRNRKFGQYLVAKKNKSVTPTEQVVEGVCALPHVLRLGNKKRIKQPLARMVANVLRGQEPGKAFTQFVSAFRRYVD